MKQLLFSILCTTLFVACEKIEQQESQGVNVSWTHCKQGSILKSGGLSDKVDVEFTSKGVHITYYDFEVPCDFTIVNATHTFVNGVLNITQQGSPNQADCVCHTDVSYTIDGISQDEVSIIFINGVQVYCYNDNNNTIVEETIFANKRFFSTKGGCEATGYKSIMYEGRIGNDFDSALDSLIKLEKQYNFDSIGKIIAIDFEYDDRLFYLINFIFRPSITVPFYVIDSRGNYFYVGFCDD